MYLQMFPNLPIDIIKYIFEFTSLPFLKPQKQLTHVSKVDSKIIAHFADELKIISVIKKFQ